MHRARVLALASAASFVFATTMATAAPPKKAGKKKKPPKTEQVAEAPAPTAAPSPPPEKAEPPKAMPVTQAADTRPAEARPEPEADRVAWGGEKRKRKHVYEDDPAHFSVAPLLGYSSTYLGFGIGARGGYTFENKLYVGGTFMFHFGYSYSYAGLYGFGSTSGGAGNVFYPAAEIGYDFKAGPVTIRPMLGGGPIFYVSSGATVLGVKTGGTAATGGIYPGVMAAWNIPRSDFFVGGDTRIVIPFEGRGVAWGFYATAGMKF